MGLSAARAGGEGGRMGAPPAIAAAVEDALKPLGVRIAALPPSVGRAVRQGCFAPDLL